MAPDSPATWRATRRGFLGLAGTSAALAALARLPLAPAAARAAPASDGRFFDPGEREILTLAVERLVATGDPRAPRVRDTAAVDAIDALCARLDPGLTRPLPLLLDLVEYGPLLFDWTPSRFSRMGEAERDASLRCWMSSRLRLRRLGFQALRGLALYGYYSQEETWPLIGYAGPLLRRGEVARASVSARPPDGRGSIVNLSERGGDLVERADVCVIGSGGGGAVAAAELAAAGRSVVVLEQGHHWTARDMSQREDEMLPRLFEEAGMRQSEDGSILVLQGRAVGGSTVHNLCYSFRTPQPILRLWREEHGLSELTPAALAPSFARVERHLKVKPIRPDEVNALNRRIRAGAERLGYSGFVTQHNREGCVQAGYCLLGCSYDAKQSMLVTYLPRARAAGARIYADARAERIEAEGGRVRRVLGRALDADGRPAGSIEVTAKLVVLAAGAVASPELLLRSGLARSGGHVGRHLHLHPSIMAAGFFDEPLHAYRGIPQSYYIDEFIELERDPHRGYVLMPIAGFPVMTATNLPGFGAEQFRHLRNYSHMGGLLVLLHDRSEGSVESGGAPGRPRIRYALEPDDRRQLAEGLAHCAEVLFAAGARRVLVPYQPEPLLLEPGDDLGEIARRGVRQGEVAIASTHPQSTCRMAADPSGGVVDAFGECFEVRGLFVADMSVFPTSLGAPPQITTAALADRTAHHILARWPELAG